MSRFIDLTGQRFGELEVLERVQSRKGNTRWLCRCAACGSETIVQAGNLRSGHARSCGCVRPSRKHGMHGTPTYMVWQSMIQRCRNHRNSRWHDYGGRGITICARWLKFENFYADMGERPAGMSIDRYPDNDGIYKPSNCRWASRSQQQSNRRKKTHCGRGLHPLSGDNVRVRQSGKKQWRECRICKQQFGYLTRNKQRAQMRMDTAAKRLIKRLGGKPLILLDGIPPLLPHGCLPARWPANETTATLLAQKVLAAA